VLQLREEAFDEVTLAVGPLAEAGFPLPVGLGGNIGCGALLLNQRADAVGVVRLVGEDDCAWPEMVEQAIGDLSVMRLTCSQAKPDQ